MKIARAVSAVPVVETLDESMVRVPPSTIDAAEAPVAPVPSGRDIAQKRPPLAGVATTTVMGARLGVIEKPLDGPALLGKRLDEIERLVGEGKTVRCVFDLDNTLFDTRGRTLHALRVFDRENGTSYAKGVDERSMQEDGRKTAIALGLPDDVVERIGTVWDREFWNPANLVHDGLMTEMIEIAKEAQKRGAELVFLTGRTEDHGFRDPTRAELARAGFDVDDAHLLLKPSLHSKTAPYKEQQMRALGVDATIGFFLTEGRRDIDHLAREVKGLTCFLLDASFERGGPACAGVPVLPMIF